VPEHIQTFKLSVVILLVLCPTFLTINAFGLTESTGPKGSNAQAVHTLGELGEGVNVGFIARQNTRITHEAFRDANGISHAFNYDSSGAGIVSLSHDTWMAGIVASRGGDSHPNDIGVAPGADIHTWKN
jgi:hypothetical protein